MTIPEQAVQAAAKCYLDRTVSINETASSLAHAMLTAAAPHLAAVRVKEWQITPAMKSAVADYLNSLGIREGSYDIAHDILRKAAEAEHAINGTSQPSAGRAAVLEEALQVAKNELEAWMRCAHEARIGVTSTPHVIDHIDMVLASHPVADKPSDDGAQGEGCSIEYEVYSGDEWQEASTDLDVALDYAAMYALDGMEDISVQEVRRRTLPTPPSSEVA